MLPSLRDVVAIARRPLPARTGRALAALVAVVLAVTLGGAAAPVAASGKAAVAGAGTADWTMMMYVVGDTQNVAEVMVRNLNRLTSIPDADNVNIVALVDLPERTDSGAPQSEIRGVGQFTTAKLLQLEGGRWNEVRDLGEVSMGRPQTLSGFIAEAADRFPARKYGLTLFDHGGAYTGGYVDIGPPGTDDLPVAEIRAGMAAGMQAAGIPRFELLYHAACLMSSYETASALAPLATTMAGSEELMFSTPILPDGYVRMAQNASGAQVAAGLVDGYAEFLQQNSSRDSENLRALAAMSVVDADRIRAVDLALEAFARAAQSAPTEIAPEIARARARALEFIVAVDPEGPSMDLVDLGDFLRSLGPLPNDVAVARNAVYAAIRSAVTYQVTGAGTQQATGLNVFLPTRVDSVGTYLQDGIAPRGWGAFLSSFLGVVAASTDGDADAQFTEQAPRLELLPEGARLTASLRAGDGARAVSARTRVLADVNGFKDALTLVQPGYLGAGGADQVQGVWDYGAFVMTDGQARVPLTAVFRAQASGLIGSAFAAYTSPRGEEGQVTFRLLLSSEGDIKSISPSVVATNGSAAGIRLEPGGTLRPLMLVQTPSGFDTRTADVPIRIGESLRFGFDGLRPGTPFSLGLLVADVSDQRDISFATGRVP